MLSPAHASSFLFLAAVATLAAVYGFEWIGGLAPCRMCLWQRWPWAAVLAVAGLIWMLAPSSPMTRAGLIACALTLTLGAGLAIWHAGIEWGVFPPLASCTSGGSIVWDAEALVRHLETAPAPPSCTEAAFRLGGLSLAGYNAIFSLALAGFALRAAFPRPEPDPR